MTEIEKLVDATIANQEITKAAMDPLALALLGAGAGGVAGGVSAFMNPKNRTRGRSLFARTLGGIGLGALAGGGLAYGGKKLYDSQPGQQAAGKLKEQVEAGVAAVEEKIDAAKEQHLQRQAEQAAAEQRRVEALAGDAEYRDIPTRRIAGTGYTVDGRLVDAATIGGGAAMGLTTAMRMQQNPARGGTAIPKWLLDSNISGLSLFSFGGKYGLNPEVLRQELAYGMSLQEGSPYRAEVTKQLAALGLAPQTRAAAGVPIPVDPNAKPPTAPVPGKHRRKHRPPPPPPPTPPPTPQDIAAGMLRLSDVTMTEMASRVRARLAASPNPKAADAIKMFSDEVVAMRAADARVRGGVLSAAEEVALRRSAEALARQKILQPMMNDWRARTSPKTLKGHATRPAAAAVVIPAVTYGLGRLLTPATQETSYTVDPATLETTPR